MIELRPFQEDMLDDARARLKGGARSILLQAPTGAGKTVLAGFMLKQAAAKGHRSFFICHRRELITQSSRTFARFGITHGLIASGFPGNRLAPVQIAGVQTLARRIDKMPPPSFVVWDECHHVAAGQWAAIHAAYPDAIHIGLSATPQRLDGTGLRAWFQHIVPGPAVAELIEDGYLADYKMYAPSTVALDAVHKTAGDFNKKELEDALNHSTITGDAVSHYQKLAAGRRAIMFEVSIARSLEAVSRFKAAGISAEHVDGETDPLARDQAMARFISGATQVLSNVDLFGEGVDVPAVEVLIDCAPTLSLSRVMQRWGRVLRPAPGKTHAIILDHAGNARRHGLPDDEREWSLDGRRKSKRGERDEAMPVKTCPSCFAVVRSSQQVCGCGHQFAPKPREIEVVDGALQEIDREQLRRQARKEQGSAQTLEDLIRLGASRGYKNPAAWARHVYNARAR